MRPPKPTCSAHGIAGSAGTCPLATVPAGISPLPVTLLAAISPLMATPLKMIAWTQITDNE